MTDKVDLLPLPEENVARLIAAKISSLEAAAKEAYDYTNMPMEVDPRYILELIAYIQALLEERDALRAEVVELRAARIAYASEFPEAKDGLPDTGSIHANIRLLKARAERLAEAVVRADLQIGDGHVEAARITLHDAMGATLSPPKQPVALAKEDNNDGSL